MQLENRDQTIGQALEELTNEAVKAKQNGDTKLASEYVIAALRMIDCAERLGLPPEAPFNVLVLMAVMTGLLDGEKVAEVLRNAQGKAEATATEKAA